MSEISEIIKQMVLDQLALIKPGVLPDLGVVQDTFGKTSTVQAGGAIYTCKTPRKVIKGQMALVLTDDQGGFWAVPVAKAPDDTIFEEPKFFTGGAPARFFGKSESYTLDSSLNSNLVIRFQDALNGNIYQFDTGLPGSNNSIPNDNFWHYNIQGTAIGCAPSQDGTLVAVSFVSLGLNAYKVRIYKVGKTPTITTPGSGLSNLFNVSVTMVKEFTKTPIATTFSRTRANNEINQYIPGTFSSQETVTNQLGVQDVWMGPDGNVYWLEIEFNNGQCTAPPPGVPVFNIYEDDWIKLHLYSMSADPNQPATPNLIGDFLAQYFFLLGSGINTGDFRNFMVLNQSATVYAEIFDGTQGLILSLTHPDQDYTLTPTENVSSLNSYLSVFPSPGAISQAFVAGDRPMQAAPAFIFKDDSPANAFSGLTGGNVFNGKSFRTFSYLEGANSMVRSPAPVVLVQDVVANTFLVYSVTDPLSRAVLHALLRTNLVRCFVVSELSFQTDFRKILTTTGQVLTLDTVQQRVSPNVTGFDPLQLRIWFGGISIGGLGIAVINNP